MIHKLGGMVYVWLYFMLFFIYYFFIILSVVRLSPLGTAATAATTGLLHQSQMIDDGDCGEIGGVKIVRGNRSTRRKPAPAPLCPPKITHDQTRARARTAAVGSQRLTAWAMARPSGSLLNQYIVRHDFAKTRLWRSFGQLKPEWVIKHIFICSQWLHYTWPSQESSQFKYYLKMDWEAVSSKARVAYTLISSIF
jgi:hypothetical protein